MRHERRAPASRTARNYELSSTTFAEADPYEGVPQDDDDDGEVTPRSRKRSRLSFYLQRRSTGAAALWRREPISLVDKIESQLTDDASPQEYRSAAQQALTAAMDVNKETLTALTHMERVMNETEAIGQESITTIRRGQENVEVMDSTLVEMEPLLKRAKRDLVVFFRRMMRDRIIVCLTIVVVGMIVAVIAVSKLKGRPTSIFTFPNATLQQI